MSGEPGECFKKEKNVKLRKDWGIYKNTVKVLGVQTCKRSSQAARRQN